MNKHRPEILIPMLRKAAILRRQMNKAGLSDNRGAIHCAERIINILGLELKYPGLRHINNLRNYWRAYASDEAYRRLKTKKKNMRVEVEHVAPLRDLTRKIMEQIESGATNGEIEAFVRRHYKLVLLSKKERRALDTKNRSTMHPRRLSLAGIKLRSIRDLFSKQSL